MPHRRTSRWIKVTLSIVAAAALVWLGAAMLLPRDALWGAKPPESLTPADIEAWLGIRLPPGTTNLHTHTIGFQDHVVHLRFDMLAGEISRFVDGNKLVLSKDTLVNAQLDRDWWKPEGTAAAADVTTYRLARAIDQPNANLATRSQFESTIQIARLDATRASVHVRAFSM